MRAANVAVVALAGVEVMVDAIDATGLELPGLFRRQQTEASADLEIVLLLDLRNDRRDGGHFALVRAAGRNDDAIGPCLPLGGDASAVQELVAAQEVVARNLSFGDF